MPGTYRGPAEHAHARRIVAALGHLWLDELTDQAVAAYLARLGGEGLAPATVRNIGKSLRRILAAAGSEPRPARTSVPAPRASATPDQDQAGAPGRTNADQTKAPAGWVFVPLGRVWTVLALIVTLAACSPCEAPTYVTRQGVPVRDGVGFPVELIETTLDVFAEVAGRWVTGYCIDVRPDVIDCDGTITSGCYTGAAMFQPGAIDCLAWNALAHEVGHAYLDDARRLDEGHPVDYYGPGGVVPLAYVRLKADDQENGRTCTVYHPRGGPNSVR